MAGFTALLVIVSYAYLFPAFEAAADATPEERKRLATYSLLLLAVVLFILFAGLILTFRLGRYFFPRGLGERRARTQYSDAWTESARRLQSRPPDKED